MFSLQSMYRVFYIDKLTLKFILASFEEIAEHNCDNIVI